MAKKDTLKALDSRGISEEVANILLTKYNTMSAISEASVEELAELGLEDSTAQDVLSKIGKRAPRKTPSSRAKKVEEPVEQVKMEEVFEGYELSDIEKILIRMTSKYEHPLPLKIVCDIAAKIENAEFGEDVYEELIAVAQRMYAAHRMDQNESAGVMAAHSLGEPGTQMNMRTFHYAGVANINVTQGLPRLIEIVDARRIPSTPSMDIPLLKDENGEADEGLARHIASEIEMTTLLDVASINTDITNMRLIIEPDVNKMEDRGLTLEEIKDRLDKVKAVRGSIEIEGYQLTISAGEPSYKKLQTMYDAIKGAKIKGIDGISRAILSKTGSGWKIVTEGSNLKEVLNVKGVDKEKVMTNSILEVADVLGIEAARNSIIHEAMGTLGEAGLDVDIRHIMLVADLMTNDGYVKAIGRHGVSGKKSSVLARAAFEITAAHLLHAAMIGEVDHLEGVTENIIVGQPVTLGTGAVKLIYTPKKKGEDE
jgi:DNA-directed RNA polymerase subunit A"